MTHKGECVVTMVIWSEIRMEQYKDDNHREHEPHFTAWVMWCASMKSLLLLVRIVIFRDVFHPIALNYTLNVRCYNFNSRNVFHWRTIRVQHIKWIWTCEECYRLLQTVADCCRLSQTVSDCCKLLQNVADCCKLLQTVADCCSHISF